MTRPTVYIETTIPSYLTARPSRDLVRAAEQQLTRDWWDRRGEYEVVTSQYTLAECAGGDPAAAARRLEALADVPELPVPPAVDALAGVLIRAIRLPHRATDDAFHIAVAAANGIQFLLTWNCAHLANPANRRVVSAVCRDAGFEAPVICTPRALLGG